jgi:hypothetical protein
VQQSSSEVQIQTTNGSMYRAGLQAMVEQSLTPLVRETLLLQAYSTLSIACKTGHCSESSALRTKLRDARSINWASTAWVRRCTLSSNCTNKSGLISPYQFWMQVSGERVEIYVYCRVRVSIDRNVPPYLTVTVHWLIHMPSTRRIFVNSGRTRTNTIEEAGLDARPGLHELFSTKTPQ